MSDDVLKEFSGLTNDQAYVNIFSKRMMKPVPNRPAEFLGCDQRIDMLPSIQKLVATLPENAQILDVGAGAGDDVDFALKNAPKGTTINIEEPNPDLIKAYLEKLKKYPHLKVGAVYEGPLQDFYRGCKKVAALQKPQDLVLAIHMIYHLTDFMKAKIDPEIDLVDAISFLYGRLAMGGSIYIVYADLSDTKEGMADCGIAEKYFRYRYPQECYANNLVAIYAARNSLLGSNGTIEKHLVQRHPNTKPKLHSEKKKSHFFGKTIEDIAVLAMATELCPSDNQRFDLAKLKFCLDYVAKNPQHIGLEKEERDVPQKGYWRANEPQVIAIITKQ
jgi:hypothetical protein